MFSSNKKEVGETMATVQQHIALSDGVTPQLQRMAQAAEATTGRFERAAAAANRIENSVPHTTVVQIENIGSAAYNMGGGFNSASNAAGGLGNRLENIPGTFNKIRDAMSSAFAQFTLAGLAVSAITQIADALASIPGKLTKASDEYSGIVARLNLITSSAAEAAAMNDQIYYSALRARGSYAGMADAVSKIGLTAKEAFPDPRAIVPFVENIQKLFTVGGTGIEQQKDAMLQLTQALGSGKLQGDEFRSIAEAAPMIEQIVARFMGVTQGQLKELSSQGAITAEIMKNAILGATDEINTKFASMPMTWGQVWQNMQTVAFKAFVPVFDQISAIANSPAVKSFGDAFGIAATVASNALTGIINNLRWLGGVATETGSYLGEWLSAGLVIIGPLLEWLGALAISFFAVYMAGWIAAEAPLVAHIAMLGLQAAWQGIVTAYTWAQNAALVVQNGGLMIAYARMGLVTGAAALWAVVTSGVTGALRILNLTLFMNPIGIVVALVLGAIAVFGAWAVHTMGLRAAIASAFGSIAEIAANVINFMIRRVNDLIGVLNKAAEAINNVFHTNIGAVGTLGQVDPAAWKKGATDFVNDFDIHNYLPGMPSAPEAPNGSGSGGPMGAIAQNTKDTADHAGKIKDAMDITDEDIKYLRDIAEQEAINKYTTAEVKIEMGGIHNNVSSDTDVDGMMRYLNDSLIGGMQAGAEKVHP